MKKKTVRFSVGTVLSLSLMTIPVTVAHADVGIATENILIKDENGNVIKEYKTYDEVPIDGETPATYQVNVNNKAYYVEKTKLLKTIKQTEESLSVVQEQTTLRMNPDIFSDIILHLDKGEEVTRLSNEQKGFIKVKTAQNFEGWVSASALKQNIRNEPFTTMAYIADDSAQQDSLYYGDIVQIVGFSNNQYQLSNRVLVNKSAISFTKPKGKLYISPIRATNVATLITSYPGTRIDPVYGGIAYHAGTDIAVPKNTPIYATADGVVITAHTGETEKNGNGLGNHVKISHGNGLVSIYGHLTSLVVKQGDKVEQGQLIGYSGTTGKSTGYHLHFEMRKNNKVIDTSLILKGNHTQLVPAN